MAESSIAITIRVFKDAAEQALRQFNSSLGETRTSLDQVRRVGQGLREAFSIIQQGIGNTLALSAQSERAISKVEQGVRSTGGAAGFTAGELKKIASGLQDITIFEDDQILNDVTAQLLTFTNIAGDQFTRTQTAALNLATVLDGDLKSASIQLGKALNDPISNLGALSRSGIQFSAEQEELIKSLAETNRLAEAQNIILDELERQYGGQAEAIAGLNSGAISQFQNLLGDIREEIGFLISEALLPLVRLLKEALLIFQGAPVFIKGVITAIIALTTAVFALNLSLGPITLTLTALAAIGLGVAAELNAAGRETARLSEEMRQNSPLLKSYQDGLKGVAGEAGNLANQLNGLNSAELDDAVQRNQENITRQLETIGFTADAVLTRIDKQIQGFLASSEEIKSKTTDLATVITVGPGFDIATQGIGQAEKENLQFNLQRNITVAESVKRLIELSAQLKVNADDSQKLNEIFREIERTINEISQSPFFAQDKGVVLLVKEIGELQQAFTQQGIIQAQIAERNKQIRIEGLNIELQGLEAQRIRLQLIQDEERRLEREFEIQRRSLEIKKQIAAEASKTEDANKIQQEIDLLEIQFQAEREVLRIQQQRQSESARQQVSVEREISRLDIERQRVNLIENQVTRLDEEFRLQEQIVQKRLELARISGREADILRLESELETGRERLQVEKDIALVQSQRAKNQEIINLLESAGQRNIAVEKETQLLRLQIEEETLLASAGSEEDHILIRQQFALRRIAIEQQEALREREFQQQRVLDEIEANRQILEARRALAQASGDERQVEAVESGIIQLTEQEAAAKTRFPEQQAGIEENFQQRRVLLETQTNQQIVDARSQLDAQLISGQEIALRSLEAAYDNIWDSITDTTRTGSEKVQAAFDAMIRTAISGLAEWLKQDIILAARSVAVHQAAEGAKTAATTQGIAARIAATIAGIAKEIAQVIVSIGAFLAQAAAKLAAWFASLGPIGFVLGLASIPALIAGARAVIQSVGKFESGAILRQPTLGLLAEGGSAEAAIPLNERGAEFMAQLLPKILVIAPDTGGGNISELVEQLGRRIENIKIELRTEMDAIQFYRNTFPGYEKLERGRKLE